MSREWPYVAPYAPNTRPYHYYLQPAPYPNQQQGIPQSMLPPIMMPQYNLPGDQGANQKGDNPREIRNKAEKQRRDKMNQSIAELASMVPPVLAASKKIDKTGVLRLTAHYLRAHQYVFGDALSRTTREMSGTSAQTLLTALNGFLLTVTYRGLVVVVSQNVQNYLGYAELDLLGQNIMNIVHEDDRRMLREQLSPDPSMLGNNGELLVPDDAEGRKKVIQKLASDKRRFVIRFKRMSQRSEPVHYLTCSVEGSLRKADRACRGYSRCCQIVRRVRARGDNPCSSGNDVVFVGLVRPTAETFISESYLEAFRMEYRTRHAVDGEIIQCEQKISLITGYMTHEVYGLNAMNFMHRDDVRWVIIALREMYDQHRLMGESCYRLMTKNGQFIYMKTRGCLEVDQSSGAVTTFVCTNTVVDEAEGRHLNSLMKKKFTLLVNNNQDVPVEEDSEVDDRTVPVEDPRQLEKVILHLVTNLPSPHPNESGSSSPDERNSPTLRLSIIPPKRERIVSSIGKIYNVIKTFDHSPSPKIQEIVETPKEENTQDTLINNSPPVINEDVPTAIQTDNQITEVDTTINVTTPTLETFENTFIQRNGNTNPFENRNFIPNVTDQVLAAVQLNNGASTSGIGDTTNAFKRPGEYDDGSNINKKKVCEMDDNYDVDDLEIPTDDMMCIESLLKDPGLNSALNVLQYMEENSGHGVPFSGLQLDADFPDLFENPENETLEDNASNGSLYAKTAE